MLHRPLQVMNLRKAFKMDRIDKEATSSMWKPYKLRRWMGEPKFYDFLSETMVPPGQNHTHVAHNSWANIG